MNHRALVLTALLTAGSVACSSTPAAQHGGHSQNSSGGDAASGGGSNANGGGGAASGGQGSGGSTHVKATYPAPETTPADVASVVASTNRFAASMYAQLREQPGNMALSPASIALALNMTRAGARGDTAAQMAAVLHIDLDGARSHAAFGNLLHGWNFGERPYQLVVANRLFGEQSKTFEQPFLALTGSHYGAALKPLSFRTAPEPSRATINGWIKEQTRGHIADLLPKRSITTDTRMVLTNAIYFKGLWQKAFDDKQTRDAPFYAPGAEVQVPMMRMTAKLPFHETDGMQLVELPYKGDALAMTLLVPSAKDGLAALEEKLSHDNLTRWLAAARRSEVVLGLPRFKIDPPQGVALKGMLMAMGMRDAFDPDKADFSGIAKPAGPPLFIGNAYHKAFIEVNEEGTEAAGATAVVVGVTSAEMELPKQHHVTADRPFVFLLRDRKSGAILFMGRVSNPAG